MSNTTDKLDHPKRDHQLKAGKWWHGNALSFTATKHQEGTSNARK